MGETTRINSGVARAIRWMARAGSIASIGLLAQFLFGESGTGPTVSEAVAMAFFPFGVVIGMVLGWWREAAGGVVTLASLALFYAWMIGRGGHAPTGPYFLLFAAPGLLFLICGMLEHPRRTDGGAAARPA